MPFDRQTIKSVAEFFGSEDIISILEKLIGEDKDLWKREFGRFLRGKPCWCDYPSPVTGMPMCKPVSSTPICSPPLPMHEMPKRRPMRLWKEKPREIEDRKFIVDDNFIKVFSEFTVPATPEASLWQFKMNFDCYSAGIVFEVIKVNRSISASQLLWLVNWEKLPHNRLYLAFVRSTDLVVPVLIQPLYDSLANVRWILCVEDMQEDFSSEVILITNGFNFV